MSKSYWGFPVKRNVAVLPVRARTCWRPFKRSRVPYASAVMKIIDTQAIR